MLSLGAGWYLSLLTYTNSIKDMLNGLEKDLSRNEI
jgi:hypothetical protein